MKNKLLLVVIVVLVPVMVYLYIPREKDVDKVEVINKEIIVHLNYNNKDLSLSLNDYLIGVVGMEMPASFNIEALKAQAVASRTFALSQSLDSEIYTTTMSQSYADNNVLKEKWQDKFDEYYKKIKNAIDQTNNQVMMYNNQIIKSYYFSMSNGKTEDVKEVFNEDLPYLSITDSSFDEMQKNFEVTTSFTKENFCSLLLIDDCNNILITNINKDDSNRIKSITINNKEFNGIDIRKKLSLRSTDFSIIIKNDDVEITTKGYGHGVGMSQYGANYLANNGYNYIDILNYYYKNISLENINV